MTSIGLVLLALLPLLPWPPAPVWAEPRLSEPSASAAEATLPPPGAREGEGLPAEPARAPQPGARALTGVAADPASALAPSGASVTVSALRLVGALAAVGVLLVLGRMAARRFLVPSSHARRTVPSGRFLRGGFPGLGRWFPSAGAVEGELTVLARSWLGPRESVCIVRSGQERFLIGVSQAGISLLSRLGPTTPEPVGAAETGGAGLPEEPTAPDFAAELAQVATAPPAAVGSERIWGSPERSEISELIARSRERLVRLTLSSPHARRRRG
jgi:hypothetical protein